MKNTPLPFNIHSSVSLITNSSTVIFSDESTSIKSLKEMVEEFAKVFEYNKTFDQMFEIISVNADKYIEGYLENLNLSWKDGTNEEALNYLREVAYYRMEAPNWLKEFYDDFQYGMDKSTIYLFPLKEEYLTLGQAILKFLRSPEVFEPEEQ
jgi:hypothetical protein